MALFAALLLLAGCNTPTDGTKDEPEEPGIVIEGTMYPVVTIGDQVWTAVNHRGPGGIPYGGDLPQFPWGRYYTRAEAEAVPLPAGWRLPTREDYVALAEGLGVVFTNEAAHNQEAIAKLLSKEGWLHVPGNNASGFNAFPAGYGFVNSNPIPGDIAEFWISESRTVSFQETAKNSHRMVFYLSAEEGSVFNVRFVRDRELS